MMDPRTGLLPGQSWNVAWGPTWQARLCRAGRAHVIGRELAGHALYGWIYADPLRGQARFVPGFGDFCPGRPRRWHTFTRACRSAGMYERMVIAAKRQEQGGE